MAEIEQMRCVRCAELWPLAEINGEGVCEICAALMRLEETMRRMNRMRREKAGAAGKSAPGVERGCPVED